MPTYEYECNKCGAISELFQPITAPARKKLKKDDPRACDCNGSVTRLIGTGAGVIFKGDGFYQTDYRSESYKKAAKADKEASQPKKDSGKDSAKSSSSESKKTTDKVTKPSSTNKKSESD